jgi:rhomboid protease GluP
MKKYFILKKNIDMPKYEQPTSLCKDEETTLLTAYQAFKNLGWSIDLAGESAISGSLPGKWNTKGARVTCHIQDGQMVVSSESMNNEMFDLLKKNKKNTQKFIDAFNNAQLQGDLVIDQNKQSLYELRNHTKEKVEEEIKNSAEVSKALNLEGSNLYVTYSIIAINVLLFIIMAINGAGLFVPEGTVHIGWGSNFSALTLSGDWWRLFTNIFIHFGIIHLLMNMYCLYSISIYLEPMLGKIKFITAYVCTGILASVVSLWWHKTGVNSAGASGAIFGMYGVFLAMLISKLVPEAIRQQLLKSIGIFIFYNLVYGMKSGVDNAAHIGGLLSGFMIGYCLVPVIKKEREQQSMPWVPAAVASLTVVVSFFYLQQNAVPANQRMAILEQLKEEKYTGYEKFNTTLGEFDKINGEVNKIIHDTTLTGEMQYNKITTEAAPALQQATQLLKKTSTYDISPSAHTKANKLLEYVALLSQQCDILKQMFKEDKRNELMPLLNSSIEKSNVLFLDIVKQKE